MSNSKSDIVDHRALGNAAFLRGAGDEALAHYSDAIAANAEDHASLSNRSFLLAKRGDFEGAVGDARACIACAPSFEKGYLRLSDALTRRMRARGGPGVTGEDVKEGLQALSTGETAMLAIKLVGLVRAADPDAAFAAHIAAELQSARASIPPSVPVPKLQMIIESTLGEQRRKVEAVLARGLAPKEEFLALIDRGAKLGGLQLARSHPFTLTRIELERLAVLGADSSNYRDVVAAQHGLGSGAPLWIGSRMQKLVDSFVYKPSAIHGVGCFAARAMAAGERLVDLRAEDKSARSPAKDGSVASFGQVMLAIPAALSMAGPFNDPGLVPSFDLLETAPLDEALAHLDACRAASLAAASVLIEMPPDSDGDINDQATNGDYDVLCVRFTVTRAVAAGEELTRSYSQEEWYASAVRESSRRHAGLGLDAAAAAARKQKLQKLHAALLERGMRLIRKRRTPTDRAGGEFFLRRMLDGCSNES